LIDEYKSYRDYEKLKDKKERLKPKASLDNYWRVRKPDQLKTFLEQTFLMDLENRDIPQLQTEEQREDFRQLLLDSLGDQNVLILMKDLRLLEIDMGERKKAIEKALLMHKGYVFFSQLPSIWKISYFQNTDIFILSISILKQPKTEFMPNLNSKLEFNLDSGPRMNKLKQFGRPPKHFFRIFDKMK
jgi:hypothetical protein